MAKTVELAMVLLCFLIVILEMPMGLSVGVYSWVNRKDGGGAAAGKEKETNILFYFHDTVSGKNPTAVKVAQAADSDKSPTMFGSTFMVDDPLTETSDPNSKILGRAQGLYASSDKEEMGLLMAMSFCFEDGPYKDSTISLFGKNPVTNPVREMPIVGGTGIFRMARGYATAKTHSFDPKTGDAVVGYNVTVIH